MEVMMWLDEVNLLGYILFVFSECFMSSKPLQASVLLLQIGADDFVSTQNP